MSRPLAATVALLLSLAPGTVAFARPSDQEPPSEPTILLPAGPPPADGGEPIPPTRWPATTLSAQLVCDGAPAPVDELRVLLKTDTDAVVRRQPPDGSEVRCSVREGRVESCPIPRGRWHLRLYGEGDAERFAPRTRWGLRAGAEPVSLGTVELVPGGSIVGRVVAQADPAGAPTAADPRTLEMRLRQGAAHRDEPPGDTTAALERIARDAAVDADGRFEIVGVPEGRFAVEAVHEGFAPARSAAVEVRAGDWTELPEPLVLRPVLRLLVEVRPAVDALGRPWNVRLHRYQDEGTSLASLEEAAAGKVGSDGLWRSPHLDAGRYTLQVVDFQEGSFAWRDVELVPGGPAEELVTVELSPVSVEGRLLLADEPLEGSISFRRQGERDGEWAEVATDSDREGEFFLVLPAPGEWKVDVRADEPTVWARELAVEVEPRGEERIARVTVEVPETGLSGLVVDAQGRPASAQVGMAPLEAGGAPAGVITDRDGRFELVGLRPGSYLVHAESGDQRAAGVRTEVAEGLETPPLRLVLRARRSLVGVVASDAGPVAGAEMLAVALGAGTSPDFAPSEATSGPDGHFRLPVPQGIARVLLMTRANGYALDLREVAEGQEVRVRLSRDGGVLRLPRADPEPGEDGRVPVVLVDGVPLDLYMLTRWARAQGSRPADDGSLAVPGMPPGEYAHCRLEPWEALMVLTGNALPVTAACSEGLMTAGGELTLGPPG